MAVIDVKEPEFMEDEEISIFADAVGKFYQQHAPEKRVLKWRDDGQVERDFWREAGEAGLLGASVPEEYGGHGGDAARALRFFAGMCPAYGHNFQKLRK